MSVEEKMDMLEKYVEAFLNEGLTVTRAHMYQGEVTDAYEEVEISLHSKPILHHRLCMFVMSLDGDVRKSEGGLGFYDIVIRFYKTEEKEMRK